MIDDQSDDAIGGDIFGVEVAIENPAHPGRRVTLPSALVGTGAELSWIPDYVLESLRIERFKIARFRHPNGAIVRRWVGPAFVHAAGTRASDDVVFGEPGDLVLLGSRSLGGLNVRVDVAHHRLVDGGPAFGGEIVSPAQLTSDRRDHSTSPSSASQ